ncbi:unnamed protein product [Closterium sp. NIES-64]|nr:unnamed protein product [Closterium sp. NIES-64]
MAHVGCTRASSLVRLSPLVPEHAESRSRKPTVSLSQRPRTPAPRAASVAAIPAVSLLAALPASAAAALAEESPATDKVRSAVGSLITAAEDLERAASSAAGVDKARSAVGSLVSAAEDLKRAAASAYRDIAGAGGAGSAGGDGVGGDTAQFGSAVGDIVSATGDLERAAVGIFEKAVSAEESVSEQVGRLLGSGAEATQKLLESGGEALQADTSGVARMIGDAAGAGMEAVEKLFQEGAPALDGVWSLSLPTNGTIFNTVSSASAFVTAPLSTAPGSGASDAAPHAIPSAPFPSTPTSFLLPATLSFVLQDSGSVPGSGLVPAPVTLLPTPFPAHHFHRAVELAPLFNALVDAVSQDADFLQSTLASAGRSDSFTAGLLRIHAEIIKEGIQQPLRLGMHRSDYMLDTVTGGVLQVELNTISSSFPGLTSRVTDLHRHMVGMYGEKAGLSVDSVPLNTAAADMADALAAAWREYGDESSLILMVVQKPERNMYDQHCLSQLVWQRHGIRVLRKSLKEVQQQGAITDSGDLTVDGHHISVVYYRAGYGPGDYPTDLEWEARLLLERSAAVKCPTIAYHLAGAKKVQQQLAQPGVLERFVSDEASLQAMRQCFAGLWSLEEERGAGEGPADGGAARNEIISKAIREPSEFVLKPQREGGGNNIYDEEITRKLTELTEAGEAGRQELAAFILMQRLFPPVHRSVLIRRCQHSWNDTLSELGVYGTYLRNGDKVVINAAAGHLLRTKTATSNEGGVASGFAVLDSPYLV